MLTQAWIVKGRTTERSQDFETPRTASTFPCSAPRAQTFPATHRSHTLTRRMHRCPSVRDYPRATTNGSRSGNTKWG